MKVKKKGLALAVAAVIIITTVQDGTIANAAGKPKLSSKKVSVNVGNKATISVKNGSKAAKVTWKTSKKSVVRIVRNNKKGNKASATVYGVKAGKAAITATYKLGKKATRLVCNVKVTGNKATDAPVVTPSIVPATNMPANVAAPSVSPANRTVNPATATPDIIPTKAPATATPTPKATKTPGPTKGPTATPLPDGTATFAEVKDAVAVDISGYTSTSGDGFYDSGRKRIEINDEDSAKSQGSVVLPESVVINKDDLATFRVQGYYYGDFGFRFWIGTDIKGGCTPIEVVPKVENGRAVGAFTCVTNGTKVNQIPVNVDSKTHAFDVTFTLKAGTSQDDSEGVYSNLAVKYIWEGEENGEIVGLVIKNVYYLPNGASKTAP